jgi:hypothetical protein
MGIRKKLQQHKPAIWTPHPEVLLDPPVPAPLFGTAPRVVMGQAWWDKVRGAAKAATNFHCIACKGKGEPLNRLDGHERYEIDWLLGRATYLETVPLCPKCHAFVHPGFLGLQVKAGAVTKQEAEDILERGRGILRAAGIQRPDDSIHKGWVTVEWSEWRLVVEGVEHPPLYESFEAFQQAMKENK